MNPGIILHAILLLFIASHAYAQIDECTIGIIDGYATTDGRPVIFKNTDGNELQQRLGYYSDPSWEFSYIGVYSMGNAVATGMNSAGLAVGNSGVIPDTGEYNYQNAATSRYILSHFSTTDEVTAFFQTQNSFRITACYPFMDARGKVMMYEVLKPRETYEPRWLWIYDPLNPIRDTQGLLGMVPRANEHHKSDVGLDDLSTGGRYETNRYNMVGLHELGQLNARTVIQGNNGSQGFEIIRYGPYRSLATVSKKDSQSAIIFHGVKSGEDPALTTMWVILGQPNYCIAVPAWIVLGNNISTSLRLGLMWDRSRSLYTKGSLFTTQASTFPAETHIFDMVYNEILPHWRTNGMPSVLEVIRVHNQIARDAYSLLNCLDNTRHNNKAPVISPVAANPENGMAVNFSVSASDNDGEIVTWSWDFGDGNTSTQESPVHTYSEEGTYLVSCTVTDNENVSSTSWHYITLYPTSVNADMAMNDNAVRIYPNPNNGSFTIELNSPVNSPYDLEIVNLVGRVIDKKCGLQDRTYNFDITDRSKGLYIVRIKQGGAILSKKVVVY